MEMLEEFKSDKIIKIFNDDNYGVAKGNNIGIKKSLDLNLDYTLLLNNDTILDPLLLEKLISSTTSYDVLVPKIYFYDTKIIWYGGGKFLWKRAGAKHINYKIEDSNVEYKKTYDYAPTCCMLIKNSIFSTIGLIDENYFLYYDDSDFCIRLYNHRIKIGFISDAILYHKVSLSTGGELSKISIYYGNRNRLYFYKKHKKCFSFVARFYLFFSYIAKYWLGKIKKDNRVLIKKAKKDFKRNKMGRCDDL